jgi:hypothetical protein
VVVTADALQTHPEAAEFLVTRKQAHYLLVVKANRQPCWTAAPAYPGHRVPVGDRTRDRGHGRVELRTLKAFSVRHFGFPHAAQVIQVTRTTRDLDANRWPTVTVYAITSLLFELARPPGRPAARALGDRERPARRPRHYLRRGRLPGPHRQRTHVMASLRNLAIGVLSRAGPVNLAAALRRHARDPHRLLATLGIGLR